MQIQRPRSTEEIIILAMTTAGALAILPFGILRLMQARYLLAVIDLGLVAVLAAQVLYVYRTQRLVFARYAVCIACLIAGTGTIYAGGPDQAFWLFPMILITFSLLKPMESALMCLGVLGVVLPQLVPVDDTMALLTLLTTIGLTLILAYAFSQQTMTQNRKLAELATRDPLTGAGNRRALGDKFRELLHQQQRDTVSASMLVFDLDHFKHINDRHGHAAGDQVLVGLVGVVRQRIRAVDTLFRIGGEEFLVIVENADTETAKKLAEDLRVLVEAAGLLDDCSVTISVGVAQLGAGETSDDWLRRGDDALYAAKRAGRNCVVCAEDSACIPGLAPIRHAGKGSA